MATQGLAGCLRRRIFGQILDLLVDGHAGRIEYCQGTAGDGSTCLVRSEESSDVCSSELAEEEIVEHAGSTYEDPWCREIIKVSWQPAFSGEVEQW